MEASQDEKHPRLSEAGQDLFGVPTWRSAMGSP